MSAAPDVPAAGVPDLPDDHDPYDSLKPQHQRFIDLLLRGVKQGPAWSQISSVSDSTTARSYASDLLTNPHIRRAYELRKVRLAARANVSHEAWLAEVADVAFLQPGDADKWVKSGVRVTMRDKLGGLMTLGKAQGWLEEKRGGDERWSLSIGGDVNIVNNAGADQRQQQLDIGHLEIGGS